MIKANSRIGEILVRRKIITPNMLQQALKLMQSNGKSQMKLNGKSRIIVIGTYKGTVYDSKWEMSA